MCYKRGYRLLACIPRLIPGKESKKLNLRKQKQVSMVALNMIFSGSSVRMVPSRSPFS